MLDLTPQPVAERTALRINPAKTCQPIGAMYAALGIHRCLPYNHGSQGCCSYHRSHLTRHFKEPVMAATSSFTEGASVFGGQPNLLQGLKTVFTVYDPDVVAITTTCLSETIGDDIPQIVAEAGRQEVIPAGKAVIHANTPSYVGSHVTGFSNMCQAMAKYFAVPIEVKAKSRDKAQVNIVPGWVDPADMREIRRLAELTGLRVTMFPDTSGVMDAPQTGQHVFYPEGGVTVEELRNLGRATATVGLGYFASRAAAVEVENRATVPREVLDLPIGISATDRFMQVLAKRGGTIPAEVDRERGQAVDLVVDAQQHFYGKKVAVFGDPDHVLSLAELCRDLGMQPVHLLTGTPGKRFEARAGEILGATAHANVRADADLFLLHQWIKNEPVDLLLGNTYGKFIARAEDLPFVRVGWPILDRGGHHLMPVVGYAGTVRLASRILDALLDRRDRDAPDHQLELVL